MIILIKMINTERGWKLTTTGRCPFTPRDRLDREIRSRSAWDQLPFCLEGATVNIFSMSHLYYHDDDFNIIDCVNDPVNALAYTISVVAG